MTRDPRIKIRIRPRVDRNRNLRIEVRERILFRCSGCSNQYHDHYIFCPQCLGEVAPEIHRFSQLRILTVPENRIPDLAQLIALLGGRKDFPLEKALGSLPWIMIAQTEEYVLTHWKNVLEAEKMEVEIQPADEAPRKRWRGRVPLFKANAPLPRFLSESTAGGVRQVARGIRDASVRWKWVELVLAAYRIVEDFYKHHPHNRILYSDFLFQIEHDLQEAIKDYGAYYKARESEMIGLVEKLKAKVDGMDREIVEVKRKVEERL